MAYRLGDSRKFTVRFEDGDGKPYDPPKVRYKRRVPAGTITTYVYGTDVQLVKVAVGEYYVLEVFPLNTSYIGKWNIRFEGLESDLTTPQAEDEYEFTVTGSIFYP